MATTDAALARRLLVAMAENGPRYALLHGLDRLERAGETSDVDVVVDSLDANSIASLLRAAASVGLVPVLGWPYDVGSLTIFFASEGFQDGVQLDLLCDPPGRARYGVRTDRLMSRIDHRQGLPVIGELDEALYLLRKAALKNQPARQTHAVAQALRFGAGPATDRAAELFCDRLRGDMLARLAGTGGRMGGGGRRASLAVVRHYARRLLHPIGFVVWAPLTDSETDEIGARTGSLLPHVIQVRAERDAGLATAWTRWRPGLVLVTTTRLPPLLWPPSITTCGPTAEDLRRELSLRVTPWLTTMRPSPRERS